MKRKTLKEQMQYVKGVVDDLIENGNSDPESSHSKEDELLLQLVRDYVPVQILVHIERLQKAELTRWYA